MTGAVRAAVGALMDGRVRAAERAFAAAGTVEAELALRAEQRRAGRHLLVPPLPLLVRFPAGEEGEDGLSWFLHKASFGSYKAPDILEATQDALVERRSRGEPESSVSYDETLRRSLPPFPPHPTPQPWLDQALRARVVKAPVRAGSAARHPPGRYDPQWERDPVSFEDLLHDATLLCWTRWSSVAWVQLSAAVRGRSRYSSRDATAALLFTLAAWAWSFRGAV